MKKEKVYLLLIILLIFILLININIDVVSAQPADTGTTPTTTPDTTTTPPAAAPAAAPSGDSGGGGINFDFNFGGVKGFLNNTYHKIAKKTESILGFHESFWRNFGIGLFAGTLLFLFKLTNGLLNKITAFVTEGRRLGKDELPVIDLLTKNILMMPLMGIIYGAVMQIPLINRIIQTVTLIIFIKGFTGDWALEALWLAILIGVIPEVIVTIIKHRREEKIAIAKARMRGAAEVLGAVYEGAQRS